MTAPRGESAMERQPNADEPAENRPRARERIGKGLLAAAFLLLAAAIAVALVERGTSPADPGDHEQVARGKVVYERYCAGCHGANLEGQPNWERKLATGRMPAPPHDASGHTWHHPDSVLFGITKYGLVPGKYAPPKYESDMPAFGAQLSDEEIWAVIAYIKSRWPEQIRAAQQNITRQARR